MKFAADIAKWVDKAKGNADAVVRQTCQEMALRVLVGGDTAPGTPVDTGFARGSWQPSLNTPKVSKATGTDKSGAQGAAAAGILAAQMKAGDTFYYLNNANYILQLERGHSAQAPVGMVGIVIAQAPAIAQGYIDKLAHQ